MSDAGVHDFAIPHEFVTPTRDMVIVRMPLPPKKSTSGTIIIPEMFRDLAVHNVAAGRIVAMGPVAFTYKDFEGLKKQDVKIGDWVVMRPYAGTTMAGGKVQMSKWRYISSFQDVIGILPSDKMPDPATLLWDDTEELSAASVPSIPNNVRETIK